MALLIASFNRPTDRRVLLTQLNEEVQVNNKTYHFGARELKTDAPSLGTNESLRDFILKPFPTYKYVVGGVRVEKRMFMSYGKNLTIASYLVSNDSRNNVSIRVLPLVNSRHFHSVTDRNKINWNFLQNGSANRVTIQPSIPLSTLILSSNFGEYTPSQGE